MNNTQRIANLTQNLRTATEEAEMYVNQTGSEYAVKRLADVYGVAVARHKDGKPADVPVGVWREFREMILIAEPILDGISQFVTSTDPGLEGGDITMAKLGGQPLAPAFGSFGAFGAPFLRGDVPGAPVILEPVSLPPGGLPPLPRSFPLETSGGLRPMPDVLLPTEGQTKTAPTAAQVSMLGPVVPAVSPPWYTNPVMAAGAAAVAAGGLWYLWQRFYGKKRA